MVLSIPRQKIVELALKVIAAGIMIQTLFFKFTGAGESVYIFSKMGIEPFGRYATGTAEAIASVFLFIPRLKNIGALISAGMMTGAILSHVFMLGISIMGDHGELFSFALIVFLCSDYILFKGIQRNEITLKPLYI
ncbi:MAG: DoxX family protein [Cytophagales bacterium]|nr:DoxX family protein [Cytophaga sp.]